MSFDRARRFAASALLICTVLGSAALAQGQPTKAEQLLKYRKAIYQTMVWNVGPMGAMAQDKAPFNAAEFAMRAGRVAALAPMLSESYSLESQGVAGSKLKAEMWQNRADFDAKMRDLVDRSAALATVAKAGDAATSKSAFFDLANACKACHEKYRAD